MDMSNWANVTLPAGATYAPEFAPTIEFSPPGEYMAALDSITPGISALTTEQAQISGSDWMDSLSRLISVLAVGEQQRQLLKVQVDRASRGLPPLNTSQYTAGANVGISSDTKLFLGVGFAALIGVMLLKKR